MYTLHTYPSFILFTVGSKSNENEKKAGVNLLKFVGS